MLVPNAVAMWVPNRVAKSMHNMVPILAQYWRSMAALLSKILDVFVMLKRDVHVVLVVVVFCVRD